MAAKSPPSSKDASRMAAAYTRQQVSGARRGTLTSAERNQRIEAARASAAARKGSGSKDKNPQTKETKSQERKRLRLNQLQETPGTPEFAQALKDVKDAVDSGKPLKVPAANLDLIEQKLKGRKGVKVKRNGNTITITLSDGRVLTAEGVAPTKEKSE